MVKQMAAVWVFFGIASLLCIENAHAYIDPGTGSMLIQALLATGVAALAFWRQIKDYLSARFANKSADSAKSDDLE